MAIDVIQCEGRPHLDLSWVRPVCPFRCPPRPQLWCEMWKRAIAVLDPAGALTEVPETEAAVIVLGAEERSVLALGGIGSEAIQHWFMNGAGQSVKLD